MTIAEACRAVNDDYNYEALRASADKDLNTLMRATLERECDEIDLELPGYVKDIFSTLDWPKGPMDNRIYWACRMCFRMGMRVQRKLSDPGQPTSFFWRTDQERPA